MILAATWLSATLAFAAPASPPAETTATLEYPSARRGDVVNTYHGTTVADPYRWLEDPDSAETRQWVDAQVAVTTAYLDDIPRRDLLNTRLTELWSFERFSSPERYGDRYFFHHNSGTQDHSVLYTAQRLTDKPIVVLDPNTLSKDGTISVKLTSISEDGTLMAYGTSDGGSDWITLLIRDVLSGRDLTESVKWVKFSDASWTHDNNGFFYSRYPEPESALESVNEHQKLYFHQIGTTQDQDTLIYQNPDDPKMGYGGTVNETGTTLFIYGWKGTDDKNTLSALDLQSDDAEVVSIFDDIDASYSVIGDTLITDERSWIQRLFGEPQQPDTHRLWIKTNKNAPKGRVIAVDLATPDEANWTEIIPESDHVLKGVSMVGGHLVATTLEDAKSVVTVYALDGERVRGVALPGIGSAYGFEGKSDASETFYAFTGFTSPTAIYRYDVLTGKSVLWKRPNVDFEPSEYTTKQVFFESNDGTRVPMFLMHKVGLDLSGDNPTILYGYGGFNISLTPSFSLSRLIWMEMGGVYAVANLRGGGEYGEEWHSGGTQLNKQNVFDDFISAAEFLIDQGYTRPDKLAIQGGSNGGLLVGACIAQRPELFGAAIPAVGVLDMLRYHKFTIGWAWADDYGTVDDSPEMFSYLHNYSPVHNLTLGTRYPSTMVVTADHDDRVVPAHSFKFAAELQRTHEGDNPVLIRIETRAGHGGGTPVSKRIEQAADQFAFLVRSLGMETEDELRKTEDEENAPTPSGQ